MTYIGEKQIKEVEHHNEDVHIFFKGEKEPVVMKDDLYKMIVSEGKREGDIMDSVRHMLSTKFLAEMSDLGLEFYMIDHITQGMQTLIHNLREAAIGKAFESNGALDIKIEKLLD